MYKLKIKYLWYSIVITRSSNKNKRFLIKLTNHWIFQNVLYMLALLSKKLTFLNNANFKICCLYYRCATRPNPNPINAPNPGSTNMYCSTFWKIQWLVNFMRNRLFGPILRFIRIAGFHIIRIYQYLIFSLFHTIAIKKCIR